MFFTFFFLFCGFGVFLVYFLVYFLFGWFFIVLIFLLLFFLVFLIFIKFSYETGKFLWTVSNCLLLLQHYLCSYLQKVKYNL